jgi:putative ABC transport system permease protein
VLVGKVTMQEYGWKVGDRVVLQSPLPKTDGSRDWAFDIVGEYDRLDDATNATQLICNFAYLDEARVTGRDSAQLFVAKIDSAKNAGAISLAIDNAFANSDHETRTQSEADLAASQVQRIGDLNFLARAIIGAVFFAMLFATGALMMQSIRERMPELAVLKTVGFSDRLVMGLILAEAITFCIFSAGIGLAIASFVLPLAKSFIGIAAVPRIVLVTGLGFAVLLGLIGSSVPAWRGLRLQVADALAGR